MTKIYKPYEGPVSGEDVENIRAHYLDELQRNVKLSYDTNEDGKEYCRLEFGRSKELSYEFFGREGAAPEGEPGLPQTAISAPELADSQAQSLTQSSQSNASTAEAPGAEVSLDTETENSGESSSPSTESISETDAQIMGEPGEDAPHVDTQQTGAENTDSSGEDASLGGEG